MNIVPFIGSCNAHSRDPTRKVGAVQLRRELLPDLDNLSRGVCKR
jgi:hypothetical protein